MYVYFTVDTESSMAGAWRHPERRPLEAAKHVFCRIDNQDFGVPLLTRIMSEFGCRATYFVETLATSCLGDADTRSVFEFLLRAGQDIQLHIHPVFRLYSELQGSRRPDAPTRIPAGADLIGHLPQDRQMELLAESIGYFERFAGRRPTAFRAGCFAGSRSMLQCLHELGIVVDSSFNPCYQPGISFPQDRLEPNRVQKIEGVWEFPVTVARTRLPEGLNGFRFADCTSLSFPEIRFMLETAEVAGQEHFVIVFHSFSAVKAKDETYAEMRPNRIVIRRLEKMFRYLAENRKRFEITTMGEAAGRSQALEQRAPVSVIANLGLAGAITRKAVQFVNCAYWV